MADITLFGHISGIRYTTLNVMVSISENRNGYKRKDGTVVSEETSIYKVFFKPYFKKYISEHFDKNMLVKIKGILYPYAKNKDGNYVDGYTIMGQTIDKGTYPKSLLRERKLIKDSMSGIEESPNLEDFLQEDF